jgi:hypothetical protein
VILCIRWRRRIKDASQSSVASAANQREQMLDVVARILPAASAIAIAALTIFNVGYFWRIGIHFLGVIDFNNFVYSFGLAFGLLIVLYLFLQKWVTSFSEPVSEAFRRRTMRTTNIFMGIGGGVFLLGPFVVGFYGWHHSKHEFYSWHEALRAGVVLAGYVLFWTNWSVQSFLRYQTSGVVSKFDLLALPLALGMFLQAGRFAAEWQMIASDTYIVTTKGAEKQATIENARLLRASSNGFIVFAEQRILLIPHSAIVQIQRSCDLDKPC